MQFMVTMTSKHLFLLLLALFATISAQNDDELHIPEENDNQFPPVIHTELDLNPKEGSGAEEPIETTSLHADLPPLLEDVQLSSAILNNESVPTTDKFVCPTKCICNIEGDSDAYVVDCSDAELTELPQPLDVKTSILNLENNKLTTIPKGISELKNLKILNVNQNQIMDIAPGSISELPELTSLRLGNNRLVEYPTDLKNSFGLTKLQEFDIGGNDMRTVLKTESFTIFKALRKLTLPTASSELLQDLCTTLKDSLEAVCVESCKNKQHDCPDAPEAIDDLDFVIPALIPLQTDDEDNEGLVKNIVDANKETRKEKTNVETTTIVGSEGESIADGAFFRAAVSNALDEESKLVETDSDHVNLEQKQSEVTLKSTDAGTLQEPKLAATESAKAELNPTEIPLKPTIVNPQSTDVEPKATDTEPKSTVVEQSPTGFKSKLSEEELTHLQTETNGNIIDTTEKKETNVETTTIVGSAGESIADGAFFRAAVSNALDEESKLIETDSDHVNLDQKQSEVNPKSKDAGTLQEPKLAATESAKAETKPTEIPLKPTIVNPQSTNVEPKSTDTEPKSTIAEQSPTGFKSRISKEDLTHLQTEPNGNIIDKTENATVGATTSSAKSGGVDKSIIAMVVAGMVLVVAGITIKKNWSSIRNRFSSTPRNANDRTVNNANGTAPEEVPLQEKSPV